MDVDTGLLRQTALFQGMEDTDRGAGGFGSTGR